MEHNPAPSVPELGLVQRIWGVFVAPRAVFEYLKVRPRVLGALAFLMGVSLVASFLVVDIITEARIDQMAEGPGVTEEQLATTEKVMGLAVPIFFTLGPLFTIFVPAAVFLFLSNVILGASSSYKQMASAFAHISMVSVPSLVVKIPLMIISGDPDVRTSLAALLPKDGDTGFLFQLFNQFDIFSLWMLGLAVVALSVMAEVPTRKAATAAIGAWVAYLVVFVPVLTLLGSIGES